MEIVIGVIGAGEADEEEYVTAFEAGREIARRKCTLICGGMGGVMEAACKGAKSEGGLTVGITPGELKYELTLTSIYPSSRAWDTDGYNRRTLERRTNCNRRELRYII